MNDFFFSRANSTLNENVVAPNALLPAGWIEQAAVLRKMRCKHDKNNEIIQKIELKIHKILMKELSRITTTFNAICTYSQK